MDSPPPGLDEAIAIHKACTLSYRQTPFPVALSFCHLSSVTASLQVMQFVESQQYSMFTRIVFDTAPTVSDWSFTVFSCSST